MLDTLIKLEYNIDRSRKQDKNVKETKMKYETVKVVKGIEIKRMEGTHGFYHINIREGRGWKEFHTFKTIKSAVEFINNVF